MKCDELKVRPYTILPSGQCYDKDEVDEAIAELKDKLHDVDNQWNKQCKEIAELKAKNRVLQSFYDLHGNVDNHIDQLKAKLESVQVTAYADSVDAGMRERRLKRALWLARAERYKMREFIAREEGNLSNQMSWSRILRERTYNQWVDQLLRIANLANKLHNKCLKEAEQYR